MTAAHKRRNRITLAGYMAGCADHPVNPYQDLQPEFWWWENGYKQGADHRETFGVIISAPHEKEKLVEFIEARRMVADLDYLNWINQMYRDVFSL